MKLYISDKGITADLYLYDYNGDDVSERFLNSFSDNGIAPDGSMTAETFNKWADIANTISLQIYRCRKAGLYEIAESMTTWDGMQRFLESGEMS
jgi:hypothetical protein